MASQTRLIFDEIAEQIDTNLEALEIQKTSDGSDAPSQAEVAAIERVQAILKRASDELAAERT